MFYYANCSNAKSLETIVPGGAIQELRRGPSHRNILLNSLLLYMILMTLRGVRVVRHAHIHLITWLKVFREDVSASVVYIHVRVLLEVLQGIQASISLED